MNAGVFNAGELAERLDVVEFEKDESLSEKLGLPSSVTVMNQTEQRDTVRLLVKEDFDLQSEAFVEFLREAYEERYA